MVATTVLVILDGWGISNTPENNGIALGKTPNYDRLLATYPNTYIQASEGFVGLPEGQMGNSEVGHLNIGAGRLVKQLLPRVNDALSQPDFVSSIYALQCNIWGLQCNKKRLHLFGLLSPGGIHSHQTHIEAIYDAVKAAGVEVVMHAFTDGRDTPPASAHEYVSSFCNNGQRVIHTLGGRYYGMDRDKRWDRVQKAYEAIVNGKGEVYSDPVAYIQNSYSNNITDEFILPGVSSAYKGFEPGDCIFMLNFRADRARQLLTALLDPYFTEFKRETVPEISEALGMVSYSEALDQWMGVCFPPEELKNTLGEYVASKGLRQLRVAETEKYAHVTFFLNGGSEEPFVGEDRILVPSPKVATYDLEPEMSAVKVTDAVLSGIGVYDLIVVNYANPDMVGHTGVLDASIRAVETIDDELGKLEKAVLEHKGSMVITADHGNIEMLVDDVSEQPHTAHTMNPVPFVVIQEKADFKLTPGALCDVAPTVLRLMKQEQPAEMTGKCLITL